MALRSLTGTVCALHTFNDSFGNILPSHIGRVGTKVSFSYHKILRQRQRLSLIIRKPMESTDTASLYGPNLRQTPPTHYPGQNFKIVSAWYQRNHPVTILDRSYAWLVERMWWGFARAMNAPCNIIVWRSCGNIRESRCETWATLQKMRLRGTRSPRIPWTFLRRYIWVPRPKYLGVEKYSYSVTDHGHSHLPTTIHTQMISYPLGGINVRRQHVDLSGSSLILHTSVLQYLVWSLKWLSPHWTPEKLHFAWPQSMKYADFVRLGVSCFVARCTLPRLLRTTHWRTAS